MSNDAIAARTFGSSGGLGGGGGVVSAGGVTDGVAATGGAGCAGSVLDRTIVVSCTGGGRRGRQRLGVVRALHDDRLRRGRVVRVAVGNVGRDAGRPAERRRARHISRGGVTPVVPARAVPPGVVAVVRRVGAVRPIVAIPTVATVATSGDHCVVLLVRIEGIVRDIRVNWLID